MSDELATRRDLDRSARPRQNPDVVLETAGRDTLLYDPRTDSVHALNPAARQVWDLCDGEHTPSDMAAHLRARFSAGPEHDVDADVQGALALFVREGLISLI